ncbi:MAG: Rdx family protein [Acetobacteraceae bacterium]|nr:Rdx family protein [Acetobacteraceae bacterium]
MIAAHQPDATVTLRKSGGGVFEITVDGVLRWSKRRTGTFPGDREILAAIG